MQRIDWFFEMERLVMSWSVYDYQKPSATKVMLHGDNCLHQFHHLFTTKLSTLLPKNEI